MSMSNYPYGLESWGRPRLNDTRKMKAEKAIQSVIVEFERETGLVIESIDYDRLAFGAPSCIAIKIRAALP